VLLGCTGVVEIRDVTTADPSQPISGVRGIPH
jgi:hypothetical protein